MAATIGPTKGFVMAIHARTVLRSMVLAMVAVLSLGVPGLASGLEGPAADPGPGAPAPVTARVLERDLSTARVISDAFDPRRPYRGDFPDPSVLRVGNRWYAYSTMAAGLNLPITVSNNLTSWWPRAQHRRGFRNEGLMKPPRWAVSVKDAPRHRAGVVWAPSVLQTGRKRFLMLYATRQRKPQKMCISLAVAKSPAGPFVDRSKRPLLCPADRGAIDPQFVRGHDGSLWVLWKSEQKPEKPSTLYSYRIVLKKRGFVKVGPHYPLLRTLVPWEQPLIENPSMIFHAGRYYLFYSAGSWAQPTYSTGYAICASSAGPCVRGSDQPLLATGEKVSGPGGAMAFLDGAGRLRLAYAAWDFGANRYQDDPHCVLQPTGCHQRRMHIATVEAQPDGTLTVLDRG